MRVLGIDPGKKQTGWCVVPRDLDLDVRQFYAPSKDERRDEPWKEGYGLDRGEHTIWRCGLIVPEGSDAGELEVWDPWMTSTAQKVAHLIAIERPEVIGIEWFEHQGYRGRRISNEAQMGLLVAKLTATIEALRIPLQRVPPGQHKQGFDPMKKYFATPHEKDAFTTALWAAGSQRRARRR